MVEAKYVDNILLSIQFEGKYALHNYDCCLEGLTRVVIEIVKTVIMAIIIIIAIITVL